jgi:hypothetical protein
MTYLWVSPRLPADALAAAVARIGLPTDAAQAAPDLSAAVLSPDAARLVSASIDEVMAGATPPEPGRTLH